jgi:hypothetical protein
MKKDFMDTLQGCVDAFVRSIASGLFLLFSAALALVSGAQPQR